MTVFRRKLSTSRHARATSDRYKLGTPVRGLTIELDVAGAAADDGPKWQHVATEGTYNGYLGGAQPFAFTLEIFQQIVKNFQSNPSFKLGAGGVGASGVVQWDFHHASEEPANSGDIATIGAPAQGWVFDVKTVQGPTGAELWALTEWLEPAKTYVKNKKYKWASVAVALDCVDKITAAQIGAVLTSIALTNAPFIEGMNELAATAKPTKGEPVQGEVLRAVAEGANVKNAYRAYSLDDALSSIRRELGLAITATLEEMQAELITLFASASSTDPTVGPAVQRAIVNIKEILGLPLLADTATVADHVMRLFVTEAVAPESEIVGGEAAAVEPPATPDPTALATTKRKPVKASANHESGDTNMTPEEFAALCKKLGVQPNSAAAMRRCSSLVAVSLALTSALGLSVDIADDRLEESVKDVKKFSEQNRALLAVVDLVSTKVRLSKKKVTLKGKTAKAGFPAAADEDDEETAKASYDALVGKLGALFKAAGVEDGEAKIAQITSTMQAASELEDVMPELAALKKSQEATEAKAEADGVAAALTTHFAGDEKHRALLTSHYKRVGSEQFGKDYPVDPSDPQLTNVLVAPTGRVQASTQQTTVQATTKTVQASGAGVVDISLYPGANDTQKAVAAYKATVAGADKLEYDQVFELACEAKNSGRFVNLQASRQQSARV